MTTKEELEKHPAVKDIHICEEDLYPIKVELTAEWEFRYCGAEQKASFPTLEDAEEAIRFERMRVQ